MNVIRADKPYTRKNVGEDHNNMYIFTDNTDRDSGKTLISKIHGTQKNMVRENIIHQ